MIPIVEEALAAYAESHSAAPDPIYERLRRETLEHTELPQMQVGRIEGRLLYLLTRLTGAQRAIEIGTFTGYSALCIAEAMPEGGTLITCENDPSHAEIARRYFAEASWGSRVDLRFGDALETAISVEGSFDLAFIDADKERYSLYWEALVPKIRSGGLLVVDNVLWSGRVLAPEAESDRAIVAFNEIVARDERVEQVVLTVRDGVTLARKR